LVPFSFNVLIIFLIAVA